MTAIARGQGRLADLLAEARVRARRTRRRVLVSVAEPVEMVDPLHALATVAPLAGEAALERTFWARPGERFAIAGVGTAADLTAHGPGAFAAIDREWAQLREDALIDDGATGMPAVGLPRCVAPPPRPAAHRHRRPLLADDQRSRRRGGGAGRRAQIGRASCRERGG